MADKEIVAALRTFNRFYARVLGVFDQYALGTDYTLAQARILVEIGRQEGCSANCIAIYLGMDRSYVARILKGFEKNGLLVRKVSAADSRKKCLWLTDAGREVYEVLEEKSNERVQQQVAGLSVAEQLRLQKAVGEICTILGEAKQYDKG